MEEENLIETLKSREITCSKLKNMENDSVKDARKFRDAGFISIANTEEQVANKIKDLRKKVCLLR